MKYSKILMVALPVLLVSCTTEPTKVYKGTYKERHEQMCVEKPAFCKYPNKNVRQDRDGRIYLGQQEIKNEPT